MSIKKEFIEKVRSHFHNFNPDTDKVNITYKGGNDSVDSFYVTKVSVKTRDNKSLAGEWSCENDTDFLFRILDSSGVYYSWIDATMNGKIRFSNNRLWVENTQCERINDYSNGYIDDDYGQEYGDQYYDSKQNDSWDCNEEKGAVMDTDEIPYDVYDLNEDGLDSYDRIEKIKQATQQPILTHTVVKSEPVIKKDKPKQKTTQKKNTKKVVKSVKKLVKSKKAKKVATKKRAVKKKK